MSITGNYLKPGALLLVTLGLVCSGSACSEKMGFRDYGAYNDENGIRLYVDKFAYKPDQSLKVTVENRTGLPVEFSNCHLQLEIYGIEEELWQLVDDKEADGSDVCSPEVYRIDPQGMYRFFVEVRAHEKGLYRIKMSGFTARGVPVKADMDDYFTTPVFSVIP